MTEKEALILYVLRLADSNHILGQRLSELCGHGPILEEDIALTNIALDLIGQSRFLYTYAGEIEGKGRTEDDLAYLRDEREYYNLLITEQENGDFADTIVRQYFIAAFQKLFLEALTHSKDEQLQAYAMKSLKEVKYHLKHSRDWVIRLGDGTAESHQRTQKAIDNLWSWTGEMFMADDVDEKMIESGIGVDLKALTSHWNAEIGDTLKAATLTIPPDDIWMHRGGKQGKHSEKMGFVLAEMQHLQRSYPGLEW